jgi:hypothetical protein
MSVREDSVVLETMKAAVHVVEREIVLNLNQTKDPGDHSRCCRTFGKRHGYNSV